MRKPENMSNIVAEQTMASPLSAIVRRAPVTCLPDTPLRAALATMHQLNIGSMIVADGKLAPLGILTLRDVLDRVALAACGLERPIADVMTRNVFSMPPQAPAYAAAAAMVKRGIRHIMVVDGGRLTGLITEKDIFNLQRNDIPQLARAIRDANSVDGLAQSSADVRQLAHAMLVQGMGAAQLTYLIASLNDLLTQSVIEFVMAGAELNEIRWCWIALGSEGRFEQTFSTDQDNGIVFVSAHDAAAVRARLLPLAQRINEDLARCGFPLCSGEIMAGNPRWCLSAEEWRARFADWIDRGDPQALMHATIFFDLRALHGDTAVADELRTWMLAHASGNPRFLHQMAANALRNRPPLGILRDFATSDDAAHPGTLDLKLSGATLFTDAARIYGLANAAAPTNTGARLHELGVREILPPREVKAWIDAFQFIQLLRLRHQHVQNMEGLAMDNRLDPEDLNQLERRILKEAFLQARQLQERLALDYRL